MEYKRQKLDEHKERSLTDLPVEITEKIFDYLTPKELLTVGQVCREFFEITQTPILGRKIQLKIIIAKNGETQVYEDVLKNSERRFFHLYMGSYVGPRFVSLRSSSSMSNIYSKIESIALDTIKIPCQQLWELLQYTKNLNTLTLRNCAVTSDRITSNDDVYLENISDVMPNLLTEIKFQSCYMELKSCDWFLKMINRTSCLKKLDLDFMDCDHLIDAYGINMQEKVVCSFIEKNQDTLKELRIFMQYNPCNSHLADKMKSLNLEKLVLYNTHFCRNTPATSMNWNSFLEKHTNLNTLVVFIDEVTLDFNLLSQNLKQLVDLKAFSYKRHAINLNLLIISKFKKLKFLYLFTARQVSLTREVATNSVLRELRLQYPGVTNNDIIRISKYCPSLELLKCTEIFLTDDGLQSVIKHLSKLKYLDLRHSTDLKITDFGISGVNCETNEQTGVSIRQLENLEFLFLYGSINLSESCLINNIQLAKINKIFITWNSSRTVNLERLKRIIVGNCPKLEYKHLNGMNY